MDIEKQVKMWLDDNSDLSEGFRLYLLCNGKESDIYKTFEQVENIYFQLSETVTKQFTEHLENYISEKDKKQVVGLENLPKPIQLLKRNLYEYYQRYRELKRELFDLRKEESPKVEKRRYDISFELMVQLIPKISDSSKYIESYQLKRELPPLVAVSEEAKEVVNLMKRKESLRTRISKLNRQIKNDDLGKSSKLVIEKELEEKENELININYQLGMT